MKKFFSRVGRFFCHKNLRELYGLIGGVAFFFLCQWVAFMLLINPKFLYIICWISKWIGITFVSLMCVVALVFIVISIFEVIVKIIEAWKETKKNSS